MIEILQAIEIALKAMLLEWLPTITEAKRAILGPIGDIKELIGTIATIAAILGGFIKLADKYGLSTWGNHEPKHKPQKGIHKSREP